MERPGPGAVLRLAWRILAHEKGRTVLAVAGVFIAILLVFVELGFFVAVPRGGMLVYDHLRFDLLLCSTDYAFQAEPGQFPRVRLAEAAKVPGVAQATPLYFAGAKWQEPRGGYRLDAFLIGFDPAAHPFAVPDIERQGATLARPDTILVDGASRSIFGPLTAGTEILLDNRKATIGGDYRLGTGFLGMAVAVMDEANFFRLLAPRPADAVNLGLITVTPGADVQKTADALARALPNDVRVFTRPALTEHEDTYWTTRTSVGLIFGSGLIISFIVGIMVLYQTLATQIARHLPEFATLKAIGYTDAYLATVVMVEAAMIVFVAFVPAAVAAVAIYAQIRSATLLPVDMTAPNLIAVLGAALAMSAASAFLSLGNLRRADPADVF
ncbi:MAG TPA: FtsX-like permease family protein [Stellaceae bacterium]|jgi:putative ABC transport system permease protein